MSNVIYSNNIFEIHDPNNLKDKKNLIYGMSCSFGTEVRYIGQTTNGLKRIKSHFYASCLKTKSPKNSWIKSLMNKKEIIKVFLLTSGNSINDLNRIEEELIRDLKDIFRLTNIRAGGENFSRLTPVSKETIEKRKLAFKKRIETIPGEMERLRNSSRVNLRSDEAREKCRNALINFYKNLSPEEREKVRQNISEKNKKANEKKSIMLIDNFGKIYSSICEASRISKIERVNIKKQLRGEIKQNKGFIFKLYMKPEQQGDDSKFLAYIKKCEEVKAQYPLPKVGS